MEYDNWEKAVDTQSFEFDCSSFDDIKVTLDLDLQSHLEVDNWKISAQSSLTVLNYNLACELSCIYTLIIDFKKCC